MTTTIDPKLTEKPVNEILSSKLEQQDRLLDAETLSDCSYFDSTKTALCIYGQGGFAFLYAKFDGVEWQLNDIDDPRSPGITLNQNEQDYITRIISEYQ
jgi:hypothetical protein